MAYGCKSFKFSIHFVSKFLPGQHPKSHSSVFLSRPGQGGTVVQGSGLLGSTISTQSLLYTTSPLSQVTSHAVISDHSFHSLNTETRSTNCEQHSSTIYISGFHVISWQVPFNKKSLRIFFYHVCS